MDVRVLEVRNLTYRMFADRGRAPTAEEVAHTAELSSTEVKDAWRELHLAHALVVNPVTTELTMANPFSAVPTAHRVHAAGPLVVRKLRMGCTGHLCRSARGWPNRDILPGLW